MPTGSALTRTARLYPHLVTYTAAELAAGVRRVWRGQDRIPRVGRTLRQKLAVLGRFLAYHLRTALDPREFFAVDGDFAGRRRGRLDPAGRRQRRRLRDLRRRRVRVLLDALGDSPQAVAASLTRHWQTSPADHTGYPLLEDYLAARLDRHAGHHLDVDHRLTRVGGTWLVTPPAVRGYLRHHTLTHQRQLGRPADAAGRRRPPVRAFSLLARR